MSDFTFLNLLFTVILLLYTNYTFIIPLHQLNSDHFTEMVQILFYKKMQLTIKPTN